MARKACLLVIAEFALMQIRGIATKQTQNFALGIATQGLFACDEQAFFKSACDDERAFCPFFDKKFQGFAL